MLDSIASEIKKEFKINDLEEILYKIKLYYIPFKRQRTQEILKAIIGYSEKEDKELSDKLLGELKGVR